MKKLYILLSICMVIVCAVWSCKKDNPPSMPVADFSISENMVSVDENVSFSNKSQDNASSFFWDFGDGNSSTDKNPSHKYAKKGVYSVTLVAMNGSAKDSLTMKNAIDVGYAPETNFDIEADVPYCTGKPIKFVNSSISETEVLKYKWSFNYGITSNEENPTHTYTDEKVYKVSLTVTNKYGDNTFSKEVDIKGLTIPDFDCLKDVAVDEEVSFSDNSTYYPTSWTWLFGDLHSSNDQNPTHSYSVPGEYTVTLITENKYGQCFKAKEETIYVGYMKDVNGNKYKTTKVGTQLWMAENLRVTCFPDSTPIPLVLGDTEWSELAYNAPAYCYYNGDASNLSTYGALYNFTAAVNSEFKDYTDTSLTQGVCPDGWHVSRQKDWEILEEHIAVGEYRDVDNDKFTAEWFPAIKSTEYWSDEQKGTDEYGLSIIPSGARFEDDNYYFLNSAAYFWRDHESNNTLKASGFAVDNQGENNKMQGGDISKSCGFGVRCVRNELVKE